MAAPLHGSHRRPAPSCLMVLVCVSGQTHVRIQKGKFLPLLPEHKTQSVIAEDEQTADKYSTVLYPEVNVK